jgi:hypothetical protein
LPHGLRGRGRLGSRLRDEPAPGNLLPFIAARRHRDRVGTLLSARVPPALGSLPHLAAFQLRLFRRYRYAGRSRSYLRPLAARRRSTPVESDFHSWAAACWSENAATLLSRWAGVFTFDPDPGRLSAAFVWERMQWIYMPSAVHFVIGGSNDLVQALVGRARELGVSIETPARVEPPVIVATELEQARRLLGDESLEWESPRAALLDLGLRARRGELGAVIDLDSGVLIDRYSAFDPGLAPDGEDLRLTSAFPQRLRSSPESRRSTRSSIHASSAGASASDGAVASWLRRAQAHSSSPAIPGASGPQSTAAEASSLLGMPSPHPAFFPRCRSRAPRAARLACEWGGR